MREDSRDKHLPDPGEGSTILRGLSTFSMGAWGHHKWRLRTRAGMPTKAMLAASAVTGCRGWLRYHGVDSPRIPEL